MGMQLTTAEVRDVIGERIDSFDPAVLAEETCFFDTGLDSLDQVQILLAIEQRFGLRVADGDFEKCNSIRAIVDYFAGNAEAKSARGAH